MHASTCAHVYSWINYTLDLSCTASRATNSSCIKLTRFGMHRNINHLRLRLHGNDRFDFDPGVLEVIDEVAPRRGTPHKLLNACKCMPIIQLSVPSTMPFSDLTLELQPANSSHIWHTDLPTSPMNCPSLGDMLQNIPNIVFLLANAVYTFYFLTAPMRTSGSAGSTPASGDCRFWHARIEDPWQPRGCSIIQILHPSANQHTDSRETMMLQPMAMRT